MQYHRYRLGLKGNIKVWLCKLVGHRINENPADHWCERCGLAYEECYYPDDWWVRSGIVKLTGQEKIDEDLKNIKRELNI